MDSSSRTKPMRKAVKRTGGGTTTGGDVVIDSIKDIVEINPAYGAYCRMPRCRYVQIPQYQAAVFYSHVRREHPDEARRRGLFDRVGLSRRKQTEQKAAVKVLQDEPKRPKTQNHVMKCSVPEDDERPVQPAEKLSSIQTNHSEREESNVLHTTPSTDPSTYCRLCFSVIATSLEPIFNRPDDDDDDADDTNLADLIEACTGVWLNANEDCGSTICADCSRRLKEMESFRRQCQRLDRIVVREREEAKDRMPIEEVLVDESTEYLVEMIQPEGVEKVEAVEQEPKKQLEPLEPPVSFHAKTYESFAMVTVSDVPYYKCPDCDTLMRLRSNISRHWNRFHRNGDRKERKMYCSETGCSKFFMERIVLKNHLELCHGVRTRDSVVNY